MNSLCQTRKAQETCRSSREPEPIISNFAKLDWSIRATPSSSSKVAEEAAEYHEAVDVEKEAVREAELVAEERHQVEAMMEGYEKEAARAKLKEDELHAELEHEEAQFIHDEADADKRALVEADAVTALQAQLEAMPEGPEKEALRKRQSWPV